MKKKVLSVTKSDCKFDYTRGSGPGGQHRNKASTAVRCTHPPSGAVGFAQDSKSQLDNKRSAFERMAQTKEFQTWAHKMASGDQALESSIEEEVEKQLRPSNLKVEIKRDGEWESYNDH